MMLNIYSVRDVKTGFMQPSLDANDKAAQRGFQLMLATCKPESLMGFCPEDFDLYRIGTFDNQTGKISPLNVPEPICTGSSLEV